MHSKSPATLTMTNKFENAFTYQKLVPIELLNISNFAVLALLIRYLAKSCGNIFFTAHIFIFFD